MTDQAMTEQLVTVNCAYSPDLNYAMQQNYVPIIRDLTVHNQTEQAQADLCVSIHFEPDIARPLILPVPEVAAKSSEVISPVRISLDGNRLFNLTERLRASITIDLVRGEAVLDHHEVDVNLLALDEWPGLTYMPEIIAAFVTPNQPVIAGVVRDAAAYLKKWTGSSAFTGYQSGDPNAVQNQMAALYAALADRRIIYNNPPASYETVGQRVRLPQKLLSDQQGTCLDLTLLYAACMEAVGLHPLIVFIEGHAFAGVWLYEMTFADCVIDDVAALEKRIVKGERTLRLIDAVGFVADANTPFDLAAKHADDYLMDRARFQAAVDIVRARNSGIHPLPDAVKVATPATDTPQVAASGSVSDVKPQALNETARVTQAEESLSVTKLSRLQIWERKLLDFSLRNTLLNFRLTKNVVQIMTADLGQLEDRLSDGRAFRLLEAPKEWTISPRDAKLYAIENQRDLIQDIASTEFANKRIRTFLAASELDARLKGVYRAAKSSMEENGANTLYLALGLLRWRESADTTTDRLAPLVLIPVEIARSSRGEGYTLRSRQDDPQINITLLEYLRQEQGVTISGVDPLPEDEHGIDLPRVFATVRQAVMGRRGWNVEEVAMIGLFSFGQFVLWNDVHAHQQMLLQNPVVNSLVAGHMTWQPQQVQISPETLDVATKVSDLAIPVSADSSQLMAVIEAEAGQSFVLHGPPGTGKSQTITNMIANALYHGKSVLFVAEKMAALNVVQKRLADIGLEPFALELHSNKANKTAVLSQLAETLALGHIAHPEDYEHQAQSLQKERMKLSAEVRALHCKREFGYSLYEAIGQFEAHRELNDRLQVEPRIETSLSRERLESRQTAVQAFAVAAAAVPPYEKSPLTFYGRPTYSLALREELRQRLEELLPLVADAQAAWKRISDWAKLGSTAPLATIEGVIQVITQREAEGEVIPALLTDSVGDEAVTAYIKAGAALSTARQSIVERFDSAALSFDASDCRQQWRVASAEWLLPKLQHQGAIVKQLRGMSLAPKTISKETIPAVLDELVAFQTQQAAFSRLVDAAVTYLSEQENLGNPDWGAMETDLAKTIAVREAVLALPQQVHAPLFAALTTPCSDSLHVDAEVLTKAISDAESLITAGEIQIPDAATDWLGGVSRVRQVLAAHLDALQAWSAVRAAEVNLEALELHPVVSAWETGKVSANELTDAFTAAQNFALILGVTQAEPELAQFRGVAFDDLITRYRRDVAKFAQATVQELVAKLSANIPLAGRNLAEASEVGRLRKAIHSNGRGIAIRKLFDDIPNLLRRINPCMLMSPISVAQYLDPDKFPKFDLVIFDEASQLPTSEAVGTIARGQSVVVVGDPKQLPPTSFFKSNRIDEDNLENEDLESLLDDCLALSMPQLHLKWHYRSRHESLIAYSNVNFYDGKLYTFPSPGEMHSAVSLVHVPGYYDKGGTRTNQAEADAVVAEILRRLRDEELRQHSIGVVTFSSVQQNLIDDLLAQALSQEPILADYNDASVEPVFVKNLENVQGDERDVILFSVGYAPDQDGRLSMNFGPLNRDGGWRRLNVAISRAREAMVVYATLTPDQIDLSRTRSEGVAGLRGFMSFAQRVDESRVSTTSQDNRDAVTAGIASALEQRGYKVSTGVGMSAYKLDLAVAEAGDGTGFSLGIIVDGPGLARTPTTRDRFVVQPAVLRGLGWRLIRVWTLDWVDHPAQVIEALVKALATDATDEPQVIYAPTHQVATLNFKSVAVQQAEELATFQLPELAPRFPQEEFNQAMAEEIQHVAESLIESLAPISERELLKAVLHVWNISRSGARVTRLFSAVMHHSNAVTTVDEERKFYWRAGQIPNEYRAYRTAPDRAHRRLIDDISSIELRNAASRVLAESVALDRLDLIRLTAQEFGFAQTGKQIVSVVSTAIDSGISQGLFSQAGDKILLRK